MSKKKLGLLPKLIIAIALGIAVGMVAPEKLIAIFATFNGIFNQFLGFIIPLIIIGFVVPGIADLGSGAGKTLAITALVAYLSTIIAGSVAYFVDTTAFPSFLEVGSIVLDNAQNAEETMVASLFTIEMPAIMGVMSALILSFTLGLGIAVTKAEGLKGIFNEFQAIISKVIASIIIPLLPFHVFGIFSNLTYSGTVAEIMSVFIKVFGIILLLHIGILIYQYVVARVFAKNNPFGLLTNMLPVYFTALGT